MNINMQYIDYLITRLQLLDCKTTISNDQVGNLYTIRVVKSRFKHIMFKFYKKYEIEGKV